MAYRTVSVVSMWDDDAGYDRDDPKHPDFLESWLDHADMLRKREKEDAHEVEHQREQDEAA